MAQAREHSAVNPAVFAAPGAVSFRCARHWSVSLAHGAGRPGVLLRVPRPAASSFTYAKHPGIPRLECLRVVRVSRACWGVPAVQASCIRFRAFACSNAPFAAAARGCLPQRNKGGGRAAAGGHSRRQAPPGRCGPREKPAARMPLVVPERAHQRAAATERFMRNQKSY